MLFETLKRVLGEEAEPDWVPFQSFVFVHTVLLRVDVECFLDSPLQTVTFAIDHFHIVEMRACCSKIACSAAADMSNRQFLTRNVRRVLLDAYPRLQLRWFRVPVFQYTLQ